MRHLVLGVLLAACVAQSPITTITVPTTPAPTASSTTVARSSTTSEPRSETSTTARLHLQRLTYRQVGPDLPFPLLVASRPGSDSSYVVTKDGRIWLLEDGVIGSEPVADIRDRVRNSGEQGLLGLALHPDEDLVYLHYSATDGDTVVSEFRITETRIDSSSERILIRHDQPAANHNGGMIAFGPDGFLYIGLGDGGGSGDAYGNGQNPDTILGALLRIDPSAGDPYLIPPDNPFPGSDAPEVWAYGLRNPWRFWIDGKAGVIYIADVGQNAFEEINVVTLDESRGANFGWPITEGFHCFAPRSGCELTGLTLPVIEVPHGDTGTCSITGGVVYRGKAIPELDGHYLYSDYCGGWLRSFSWDGDEVVAFRDWTEDVGVPGRVTSFGVDGSGEIYVTTTERVYRLEPVR